MNRIIATCLLTTVAAAVPVAAQDTADRTATIEAQTALTKAEAARLTAEADLARTRIGALGLPSFEGKTSLEGEAGKMEAMQMASYALADAARVIARDAVASPQPGCTDRTDAAACTAMILLTMSEPFDLGLADSIKVEMDELQKRLGAAVVAGQRALNDGTLLAMPPKPQKEDGGQVKSFDLAGAAGAGAAIAAASNPLTLAVAGIGAVAGLIRSETTINGFGVTEMDDAMLIRAIAKARPGQFIVPGAIATTTDAPLLRTLEAASGLNDTARQVRDRIAAKAGKTPTPRAVALTGDLDLAIKRFEAFHQRVVTASATGRLPIVEAARLDGLRDRNVLRVHVDRAGGSLINSKNIATFFGADPIRVTAGMVASYVVTDPASGVISKAGVITCRTAMTRLRYVQEKRYGLYQRQQENASRSAEGPLAECTPLT